MPARLLPLGLLLLAGCDAGPADGPAVTGSGVAATDRRPLDRSCRAVTVSGTGTLTVKRGERHGLAVTWDDNLVAAVVTEVRDGVLEVSLRPGSYTGTRPLAVAVTLPELTAATADGQAAITAEVGVVPAFVATAGGQSRITLTGAAASQTLRASGQSAVDARGLGGESAAVDASGQATVMVAVAGRVTGSAGGQSTVEAAAAKVEVTASGQAVVRTAGTDAGRPAGR